MALNLRAFLTLDGSGFERNLLKAKSQATKAGIDISSSLKGHLAAAFGIGAMTAATRKVVQYGSQISDLSKRLGVSTEALQEFNYAATQNGASVEEVAGFLTRMAKARDEALGPNGEKMLGVFQRLGVSAQDLKSKRLEDIFRKIGDAVRRGDVQALTADIMDVGGRGGPALIPMLQVMQEMAEEARKFGQILEDSVIRRLDEMGDQLDRLAGQLRGPFAEAVAKTFGWANAFFGGLGAAARSAGVKEAFAGKGAKGEPGGKTDAATRARIAMVDEAAASAAADYIAEAFGIKSTAQARGPKAGEMHGPFMEDLWKTGQMFGPPASLAGPRHPDQISRSRYQPQLNALQQIGGYVGADPMITETRKQTESLRSIERNAGRIEEHTSKIGEFG